MALVRARQQLVPGSQNADFNTAFAEKFRASMSHLRPDEYSAFLAGMPEELNFPTGCQVCCSLTATAQDTDQRSSRRGVYSLSACDTNDNFMTLDMSKGGFSPTVVLDRRHTEALAVTGSANPSHPRVVRHQLTTHPQTGATMHKQPDCVCFSASFNRRHSTCAGLE